MAQLLSKYRLRSVHGSTMLASVVKQPVQQYLPANVTAVGTSKLAPLVKLSEHVKTLGVENKPLVFVIGAVSVGNPGMENDLGLTGSEFHRHDISISKHGLSAACVCGKATAAMERLWGIV